MFTIIGGIAIGLIVGGVIVFFILKKRGNGEEISETIALKLNEIMPSVLDQANESLIRMANEKLVAESKQNRVDIENKRGEIERLVKTIKEDLNKSKKELEASDKERINTYSSFEDLFGGI